MASDGVPTVAVAERIYKLSDDGWGRTYIAFMLDVTPECVQRTLDRRPEKR